MFPGKMELYPKIKELQRGNPKRKGEEMKCRATDCQNDAETSGLCPDHYLDWRTTIDSHKNSTQIKERIEKKIDLSNEPKFTNLEDFR